MRVGPDFEISNSCVIATKSMKGHTSVGSSRKLYTRLKTSFLQLEEQIYMSMFCGFQKDDTCGIKIARKSNMQLPSRIRRLSGKLQLFNESSLSETLDTNSKIFSAEYDRAG